MFEPKGLFENREAATVERFDLVEATLSPIQPGQVHERCAYCGVLGPERLLPDGKAAPVERLGLAEATLD
jgi:hypothetical protein